MSKEDRKKLYLTGLPVEILAWGGHVPPPIVFLKTIICSQLNVREARRKILNMGGGPIWYGSLIQQNKVN